MMSIGVAVTAATTLVGQALPAGLMGERPRASATPGQPIAGFPAAAASGRAPPEDALVDGALLEAVEAGLLLREAGYLRGARAARLPG
ncbi:hypothetical protein SAMN04487843_107136 [Methylobacterium sp. ap11]|uniref:hypothetical protein n=1 Tax=Methylobacterium sp. ap11 TaxID=1761799 RepID=UPI0008D1BF6E|nr:hypothetical protein [Methylobacterium sp. ap11]SEP14268.1 hypothetical protein SAMN04487843_107136 [Methylobacterium sp. ap11]